MGVFKDVVGHNSIVEYMEAAVRADAVSHAYIISGQRGAGKKLLAKLFSMSLQCTNKDEDGDACGQCQSCKQALSANHPDIIWVSHEKPATISVEEIRKQVVDDVRIRPYASRYKIYIVPDAEMLSVQAQNALLKTIEEPPEYVVIFLLTENEKIFLPTIQSRCVMLKLRNVKDKLVKQYLIEQLKVPADRADMCAAFARGNIGRAVSLAQSENFQQIKDEALRLLRHVDTMTVEEWVEAIKGCIAWKLEITEYLDILAIWYRDVLLYKATKNVNRLVFEEELNYIKIRAAKSSYEGIENILEGIEKAKARLRANVNFELTMELLLLTIREN